MIRNLCVSAARKGRGVEALETRIHVMRTNSAPRHETLLVSRRPSRVPSQVIFGFDEKLRLNDQSGTRMKIALSQEYMCSGDMKIIGRSETANEVRESGQGIRADRRGAIRRHLAG
jgi:hypothetical protein